MRVNRKIGLFALGFMLLGAVASCSSNTNDNSTSNAPATVDTTTANTTPAGTTVDTTTNTTTAGTTVDTTTANTTTTGTTVDTTTVNTTTIDTTTAGENTGTTDNTSVINKYTITIDNPEEGITISGITSGNQYDYDSQITLTASNIPSGSTIKWTRSDGDVYYGDKYVFKVPSTDINITIATRAYTINDSKLYFGSYPQTKITDNTLISELNTLAGTKPTSTNKYKWTDYNYYISSYKTSFMFYQDIDYDNNGTYDYRGVYFTQYRPSIYSNTSSKNSSYQDDNGYTTNTIYWFSYDPIEWDILTESSGKAQIIANLILDSQEFYPSSDYTTFNHNGGTGLANNYELSNIRKFLNDNFYNTAFSDLQKTLIETTNVETPNVITADIDITNDKMFLLSYKEVTTYYDSNSARMAKGSDYAKSQGLYVYKSSDSYQGNSFWWLCTPYINYTTNDSRYQAYYITLGGELHNYDVNVTRFGVRPACIINIIPEDLND